MSLAPRTRTLCSRCLESFTPEAEGGEICPSCRDRARGVVTPETSSVSEGASTVAGESAVRSAPTSPISTTAAATGADTLSGAAFGWIARQKAEAAEWCEGRMPWFRIGLWLYLAGTFSRHLGSSEPYRSMFDGINLGIHEFGHAIFRSFGEWFHVAGGTLTQLAAPIATLFIFRKQKDFFGMSVALCWLATNLWGVSVYMGDARALELPLVAPGMGMMPGGDTSGAGGIIHDWNYLLGSPGLLKYDTLFSGFLATLAVVTMAVGLAVGAWLIVRMLRSKESPKLDFENF